MKKPTIVLASLLKPVDDTRMFEKLGRSLEQSGKYQVIIVGYPSSKPITNTNIRFYPLPKFKRLSIGRLMARLKVLQLTLQVRPQLFIATTHELLIVAVVNRILFGTKIIYDIQENYYRNILYSSSFPAALRLPLAALVRLKEKLTYPIVSHYFLAERGYQKELTFIRKKFTIIENKCSVPGPFVRVESKFKQRMLFTGTLAESTGIFEVISLVKKLHSLDSRLQLLIIGYCALSSTYEKLLSAISDSPYIQLTGGNFLVPHAQIVEAIQQSDAGFIYYPPSPHTINSVPTKLYEYLAYQLPIITQPNELWESIWRPCAGAVTVDFTNPDAASLLESFSNHVFYTHRPINVIWESEEPKLLSSVEVVLK